MRNQSHAVAEARSLLALLQSGETVPSIRALIGAQGDYRRFVRLQFDALVARLPRHGNKLRRNVNTTAVSEELKAEVQRLLRAGWSHARIRGALPVGPWIIYKIAKQIGASYCKTGRGRRFTSEQVASICAAVRSGKPPVTIAREFHIDAHTVWKLRRQLGDYEDRRHRKKSSAERQ